MSMMLRPATDFDMYEVMEIRNSGRENMTHDTHYITPEEQFDWWTTKDNNLYKIWIATTLVQPYGTTAESECEEVIIGFGMLRTMLDGMVWGTLAVYPDYQGMGYGTAIYKFLAEQNDEVWIEINNTNLASYFAAKNAGFEIYFANDRITTMVHRK